MEDGPTPSDDEQLALDVSATLAGSVVAATKAAALEPPAKRVISVKPPQPAKLTYKVKIRGLAYAGYETDGIEVKAGEEVVFDLGGN